MVTGEYRARRRKEAGRERLIERLDSEEQRPGRGEAAMKEGHDLPLLAAFSPAPGVFG